MTTNNNYRGGYLQQGSAMPAVSKTVMLSADNQLLNATDVTVCYLQSDNTTPTNRTFTLQDGTLNGQKCVLVFTSGSSYTADLQVAGNFKGVGAWQPLAYDTLEICWDGTYWIELARGNAGSGGAIAGVTLADGAIFVGDAASLAAAVVPTGDVTISNTGVTTIGADKVTEAMLTSTIADGLYARRGGKGVYNTAAGFGIGAHTIGVTIPANSFITGAWYWVKTTFTSATDAGTIAISVEGANDIVTATAISVGTTWDATGVVVEGTPKIETTASWVKTTTAKAVTVTVAGEAITAGVMYIWVEYITME